MQQLLDRVGCSADLKARVESLGVADRQLLELAKALAINPRVLILDEPTAALGADAVDALFDEVRRAAAAGTAVVYITHRLAEVRQIADRVTVLRDGSVQGAALVSDITDEEILRMIVGRTVESVFPPKRSARESASPVLRVEELSGDGFESVSFEVQPGEVDGPRGHRGKRPEPRSCAPSLGWPTPPARLSSPVVHCRSAAPSPRAQPASRTCRPTATPRASSCDCPCGRTPASRPSSASRARA